MYTSFYLKNSPNFHEALVDITSEKVLWQQNLGTKIHAPGTSEEIERMHDIAMRSDLVKKEILRLKLIEGTQVVCEPWPYGKDGINDDERLFQVLSPQPYVRLILKVLFLPCLNRSKEKPPIAESLRTPSRLFLHRRRSSRGSHSHRTSSSHNRLLLRRKR